MHTWHIFDSNNWIEQTFQQNIGHAVLFGNILEHKLTSSSGTRKNKQYGCISLNYNINLEGVHGHSVRILYLRLMPATTFLFYGTRIMLLTCHFIYIFLVFSSIKNKNKLLPCFGFCFVFQNWLSNPVWATCKLVLCFVIPSFILMKLFYIQSNPYTNGHVFATATSLQRPLFLADSPYMHGLFFKPLYDGSIPLYSATFFLSPRWPTRIDSIVHVFPCWTNI